MDETQQAIDACTKAIKRIEGHPTAYRFDDWTHCACGHLYRAVEGRYAARTLQVVHPAEGAYAVVLKLVAEALGWRNRRFAGDAAYVSDRAGIVGGDPAQRRGAAKAVETLTTARAVLRQRLADQEAAECEAALAQTPHDHNLIA